MRGIQGGGISFCILAGMRENAERSAVALATCIFVSIHLVHAHNNTFSSNEHYCKVESCLSPHRSIFRHIRAFKLVGVGKRTGYVLLMISACSRQSRKTTDHRWRDELCQDFWHAGGLNPVRFPPPPPCPNTGPAARIHAVPVLPRAFRKRKRHGGFRNKSLEALSAPQASCYVRSHVFVAGRVAWDSSSLWPF